jgi:hypothetical protein
MTVIVNVRTGTSLVRIWSIEVSDGAVHHASVDRRSLPDETGWSLVSIAQWWAPPLRAGLSLNM